MKNNDSLENWKAARELFEDYLEKPSKESLANIDQRTDIADDIKEILIKLVNAQDTSDTQVTQADLSFFNSLEQEAPDLTGKIITNYALIKRLGKGGMSHVYEAKRLDSDIQKHVAIKILHNHIDELNETLKQLFIREQQILSKLNHPNIISFHHGGISASDIPFLVMDCITDARPIHEYCRNEKLSQHAIIEACRNLADALDYAHRQLVVHKDIKPSNILVDSHGDLKIVDFGIATFQKIELDGHELSPQIYTPDFASPEQILNQDITPASDIFSLTAVLLALLTEQKPLAHTNIQHYQAKDDEQHIQILLKSANFDNDLCNIINKGLKINPQERYSSMQDLRNDLDNYLQSKPVSASKQTSVYLLKKFIQRHTLISFLFFALMISITVGIYSVIKQKNQAQHEALKAKQVTQFLIESIQASDPDLTKGQDFSVKEFLNNAKVKIQESTFQDRQLSTALKQTIGTALSKIGQYKDAENLLLQAIKTDPNNFVARIHLAKLYIEQKLFDQAQKQLNYLKTNLSQLPKENRIDYQLAQVKMLVKQVNFKQAENSIIQLISSLDSNNTKQIIESKSLYASILDEMGRPQKAIDVLNETLELSHQHFGEISTTSAQITFRIAQLLSNISSANWDKIYQTFTKTSEIQTKLYGKNHPIVAKTHLSYGFSLRASGQLDKAKEQALIAKKIALKNFDASHILVAHIDVLLTQISALKGDFSATVDLLEQAIATYERHYGVNHIETNQVKTTLAAYYLKLNQGPKALQILQPLYISQKKQLGDFNKATLYVQLNIIKAHLINKDFQEAIKVGEAALKVSQEHIGKDINMTIGIQFNLAKAYIELNNHPKAIALIEPLLETSQLKQNSMFDRVISIELVKSYLATNKTERAKQLIERLLNKHYGADQKKDALHSTLIELKNELKP